MSKRIIIGRESPDNNCIIFEQTFEPNIEYIIISDLKQLNEPVVLISSEKSLCHLANGSVGIIKNKSNYEVIKVHKYTLSTKYEMLFRYVIYKLE